MTERLSREVSDALKRALWAACAVEGMSYSKMDGRTWMEGAFDADRFVTAFAVELGRTHELSPLPPLPPLTFMGFEVSESSKMPPDEAEIAVSGVVVARIIGLGDADD